jgi:phosphatidylglycerol lysyltransferase
MGAVQRNMPPLFPAGSFLFLVRTVTMTREKFLHSVGPVLGLVIFSLALWFLHNELKTYHLHDIINHAKSLPIRRISWAFLLTIISYLTMTGYDSLALKYIGHPLSYTKTAFASFVGYSFSNNVGFSMLAGGSVRYRLYSYWGLTVYEITKVILFCTATLWLGFLTLAGIIFLLEPIAIPPTIHVPFVSSRILGLVGLLPTGFLLLLSLFKKKVLHFRKYEIRIPSFGFIGSQMAVAILDWFVAGCILYVLLPELPALTLMHVLGVFLLAQLAGLASQIPGGLGVFESVVVVLLSPIMPASEIVGSLLVYRGMYYILPLLIAALLLGAQELTARKEAIQKWGRVAVRGASVLLPNVLALTTFLGGVILLFSGSTPAEKIRFEWVKEFIPLPVLEVSHLLGSVAGIGLLVLARGLQRRIDAAHMLALAFLGTGIVMSILKGFDYEEAAILIIIFAALVPCRRFFYRKAALLGSGFTPAWTVAVILVLLCSAWLILFSYKHVEYSNDLWWNFTLHGHASRSLRALVGATGLALVISLYSLLRPGPLLSASNNPEDIERVRGIVRRSPLSYANLALLGDKYFLLNNKGDAFLMYGVSGRSWVVMGDPIGPMGEWPELVWQFRELCDRYDGWPVFYEISIQNLPLYLDLGLTLAKIGEEGRVELDNFSLEGNARKGLRHIFNKFEKEGFIFEVVHQETTPSLLAEMKKISDQWLQEKKTREKGFSLGFFSEDYLKQFPVAIVRKDMKIIAFANLWQGAGKEELSPDLMRHLPEAPNGIMDYLFLHLMFWGKNEGYQWFNLGMAPFSGMEARALAPLWNRLGAFLFRYGEYFYNFQGLRQYKLKFGPVWEPRYLVSPSGHALPVILTNIAALISGGMKGVVTK